LRPNQKIGMKYSIIAIIATVGILISGCQPSKDRVAKNFKEKCITNISNQDQIEKPDNIKKMMEDACGCMGEKLADNYSAKEVDEIAEVMNSTDVNDIEKRNELAKKIGPLLHPCILEMQQKMMEAMAADTVVPEPGTDSAAFNNDVDSVNP